MEVKNKSLQDKECRQVWIENFENLLIHPKEGICQVENGNVEEKKKCRNRKANHAGDGKDHEEDTQ